MRLTAATLLAAAAFALSGCAVYDVASTTVGVVGTVVGTTVDVAGDAVCTIACSSDDAKK